ncbi:NAD(P)H-dependent oxidoreductase [Cupriavidus sp. IDO]|uniref:NAD(P)H-dependent oxidoreductase n=1 Tax=Cupriavidus sp. IDO TaxID=1539142 RepID=UPI00057939E5|nr:NAD(P)H-dependent oxidoreductase [Cupriavidus sp. IDO]KWR77786.1 NAD(P)H dehydrogenase [Cupriavidus sp. IDO]
MSQRIAHIVYAHFEQKSFVGAMRDTVVAGLREQGWKVTCSDLYAQRFNPVAHPDDFVERRNPDYLVYSLEQRHAVEHEALAPDIAAEVESVKDAGLLVFVFPVFWFSVPAILKGWIDRVFLSGVFYGGRRVYDRGGMVGKRALVVTSLGGRSHMFGEGAIHGEIGTMLRHLLQGSLAYVGYDVLEPFIAYHVPYIGATERKELLRDLQKAISTLDSRQVLSMPSLNNFDDEFRPLVGRGAV